MFAGLPGTGIGAIFYALVALHAAIKNPRGADWRVVAASLWILSTMLIFYSGMWEAFSNLGASVALLRAATPLALLSFVLAIAGLYALIRRKSPRPVSR
jgi:hypothetical protein